MSCTLFEWIRGTGSTPLSVGKNFSKQVGWVYTVQMGPAALCFGIDKWEDLFRIVLCFQIFTGVLHLK